MQRYPAFVGLSVVIAFVLAASARSQEPAPADSAQPRNELAPVAKVLPATSVFNDRLRRFKFELEHVAATQEAAEGFVLRYQRPDNPPIIGAYPDDQTNSLVVIGPPESEQAIRESLAQWIVASHGLGGASLAMQLRLLQQERKGLLEQMAELEVHHVKATGASEAAKAQQIADRLQAFEGQMHIVERQIQVVRKYMDRLCRHQLAGSTSTAKPGAAP